MVVLGRDKSEHFVSLIVSVCCSGLWKVNCQNTNSLVPVAGFEIFHVTLPSVARMNVIILWLAARLTGKPQVGQMNGHEMFGIVFFPPFPAFPN